jgi:DNA-binding response OmpR family regulator
VTDGLLILEAEPGRRRLLAEYCATRGYRPRAAASFAEFADAWEPGLRMVALSLPLASTDGIEAIRFLGEQRCEAG